MEIEDLQYVGIGNRDLKKYKVSGYYMCKAFDTMRSLTEDGEVVADIHNEELMRGLLLVLDMYGGYIDTDGLPFPKRLCATLPQDRNIDTGLLLTIRTPLRYDNGIPVAPLDAPRDNISSDMGYTECVDVVLHLDGLSVLHVGGL